MSSNPPASTNTTNHQASSHTRLLVLLCRFVGISAFALLIIRIFWRSN